MAEIMQTLTITVKMPRLFHFRLWLGCKLVKLGGCLMGCAVVEEASEQTVLPSAQLIVPMPPVKPPMGARR